MRWNWKGGWLALALLGAAGCDQSKAELEQTRTQLQAVTTERDALKTQVAALQTQVSTLQGQPQQAMAQQTAAQPAATAPEHGTPTRRPSSSASSPDRSRGKEPPMTQEQKAADEQMTGRSSMNN